MIYSVRNILQREDFMCLHGTVYCAEFSGGKLNVFGGVEWRVEAGALKHYCINRFEFQRGLYQEKKVFHVIQHKHSQNQKKLTNINSLHLPHIAMKIAKNTVPPLSKRRVT